MVFQVLSLGITLPFHHHVVVVSDCAGGAFAGRRPLNPIEQLFAKLKHLIRKAEPRTIEATWRKVGDLLDLFSPAECANYLKNAGYASV